MVAQKAEHALVGDERFVDIEERAALTGHAAPP
jgi:hypothetical protein